MSIGQDEYGNIYEETPDGRRRLLVSGTAQPVRAPKPSPTASLENIAGNYAVDRGIDAIGSYLGGEAAVQTGLGEGISAMGGLDAGTAVGSALDGSTMLAGGGTAPMTPGLTAAAPQAGVSLAQIGGPLLALYGGYNAYDALSKGQSSRTGLATAGAGVGLMLGGPVGAGIGAVAGSGLGYLVNKTPLKHKSTAQERAEHMQQIAGQGENSKRYIQTALAEEKDQYNKGQRLDSGADPTFAGYDPETGRWRNNKYAASGNLADLQAQDVWGSYGILNMFGEDYWTKMSPYERYAISRAALDNGLIKSKKGDLVVTDPDKLRSLADSAYKNEQYKKDYAGVEKSENKLAASKAQPQATSGASGGVSL